MTCIDNICNDLAVFSKTRLPHYPITFETWRWCLLSFRPVLPPMPGAATSPNKLSEWNTSDTRSRGAYPDFIALSARLQESSSIASERVYVQREAETELNALSSACSTFFFSSGSEHDTCERLFRRQGTCWGNDRVSRSAVISPDRLHAWCKPFLCNGGLFRKPKLDSARRYRFFLM